MADRLARAILLVGIGLIVVSGFAWGSGVHPISALDNATFDRDGLGSPDHLLFGSDQQPAATPDHLTDAGPQSETEAELERAVHDAVNDRRADHGVPALERDDRIDRVARKHSADMAERGYFDHTSPEGHGPGDRMGAAGMFPGECRAVGENIAYSRGYDTKTVAEQIVDGWMASPGHRENLLHSRWDTQGIGIATTDNNEIYATQVFCQTH